MPNSNVVSVTYSETEMQPTKQTNQQTDIQTDMPDKKSIAIETGDCNENKMWRTVRQLDHHESRRVYNSYQSLQRTGVVFLYHQVCGVYEPPAPLIQQEPLTV